MSNYWNKREALVNIAHELMDRGWKVLGYKEDRSDSMTDYFDPASWDGIATKNGFVLVVDNDTAAQEREITKYNPKGHLSFEDQEKIKKLEMVTQEHGATPGEERNAKEFIKKIQLKVSGESQYVVVGKTPAHMANPGKCKWHIEKDGKIYDKGTGIIKFAHVPANWEFDITTMKFKEGHDTWWGGEKKTISEEQEKAINSFKNFILRIERVVNGMNSCGDGTTETEKEGLEQQQKGLEKIIVKETKKSLKMIKVERNYLQVGDYITLAHHGHYWKITEEYMQKGTWKGVQMEKKAFVYEIVGAESRGYQKLKNAKRYYQYEFRMLNDLEKGNLAIYELKEVEEVIEVEKWVKINNKKSNNRKQTETKQEEQTTEQTQEQNNNSKEPATKKQRWALHVACNKTINTRDLEITKGQASELITKSLNGEDITEELKIIAGIKTEEPKQEEQAEQQQQEEQNENEQQEIDNSIDKQNVKNIYFKTWNKSEEQINIELQTTGFYYKQLGEKFYIKVTPETYQDIYSVLEKINQYNGANLNDSEIDYTATQEEINEQLKGFYENITEQEQQTEQTRQEEQQTEEQQEEQEEDIFNKFDNFEFEATDRIEEEDKNICKEHQQQYNEAITILNSFITTFKEVSGIDLLSKNRHQQKSNNKYLDWYKFDKVAELARETKEKFINNIIWHFTQKYSITIKSEPINNKYDFNITYDNIIDEIFIQLDGFTFKEKADKEIKEQLKKEINYEKITIKNNKFTVTSYAYFEKCWNNRDYRITYYGRDRLVSLFKALTHFDSGKTSTYRDFQEFISYSNEQAEDYWFTEFDYSYKNKIDAIRFYKNGKIDIKFKSNEYALQFAREYCGYMSKAA